jgi:hypothetical protein
MSIVRAIRSRPDGGGNIDIAYFQSDTDPYNEGTIICGDDSVHADGWCKTADKHIVDLPRQAFFMAKLTSNSRTRVIGIDKLIAPLVIEEAAKP